MDSIKIWIKIKCQPFIFLIILEHHTTVENTTLPGRQAGGSITEFL